MFGLGTTELIVIAVIVLLLFGSRLPSVMRSLGQGVVEFKKGLNDIDSDVKKSTNRVEDQLGKPPSHDENSGG